MDINNREKKIIALNGDPVRGEKLEKFISFCFKISDEISFSTIDLSCMTKEEARVARAEYDKIKIERYSMEQEEMEEKENETRKWLESRSDEFGKGDKKVDDRMVRREVTCRTHCTVSGDPGTVYYFKTEPAIQRIVEKMENLYAIFLWEADAEVRLEDLGFYKDGEVVVSICSHELLGYLLLSEEEYREFEALRVPHVVRGEEMSLKERLKKCAYEEWESLTLMREKEESVPEEVGEIKSLKKLEIFDHAVKYLPKTLEELTELECLRITGNQVEELGFDLSKLIKLKILDFSGMPLKQFPEGILELKGLEKVYVGDIQDLNVPEGVMELPKLQVLCLPEIKEEQLPENLREFLEEVKPKQLGMSLREILGHEKWQEIVNKGDYIISSED